MSYYEYTMEKLAFTPPAGAAAGGASQLGSLLSKVIKPSVAGAFVGGIGLKMLYDRLQNDKRAKTVIEDLMRTDPIISKEDPETVKQYAATVFNLAPSICRDKNVMKSILQNFIKFGTVDMKTVETLAGIQKTIDDSQSKSFPFMSAPLLGKLI